MDKNKAFRMGKLGIYTILFALFLLLLGASTALAANVDWITGGTQYIKPGDVVTVNFHYWGIDTISATVDVLNDGGAIAGSTTDVFVPGWPWLHTTTVTVNANTPQGLYEARVKASDSLGAESKSEEDLRIFVDTTPPTLDYFRPMNGSVIGLNTTFSSQFQDNFSPASVGGFHKVSTDSGVRWLNLWGDTLLTWTWPLPSIFYGNTVLVAAVGTDTAGNTSTVSYTYTLDTSPPAVPVGLTATGEVGRIKLTWNANSENDLNEYAIYRSRLSGTPYYSLIDTVFTKTDPTPTLYYDTSIEPNETYYYALRAVDNADNFSGVWRYDPTTGYSLEAAYSNEASAAAAKDTEKPKIVHIEPLDGATISKTGQIKVYATDNVEVEKVKFEVSGDGGTTWSSMDADASPSTWASLAAWRADTTLNVFNVAATSYKVKVTAYDKAGNPSDATTYTYNIDSTNPSAPAGVAASIDATKMQVKIIWNAVADAKQYLIWRGEKSGEYIFIGSTTDLKYFDGATLVPGKTYYYVVQTEDLVGNISGYSAEVALAIPADTAKPVIASIDPISGSYVGKDVEIQANVSENLGLFKVVFEYSVDNGTIWKSLYTDYDINFNNKTAVFEADVDWSSADVSELPEGNVLVRVTAYDKAMNVSDSVTVSYIVLRTPPLAPTGLVAIARSGNVKLTWNPIIDPGFDHYMVYRAETPFGSYGEEGIAWTKYPFYTDMDYGDSLVKDKTYYYVVQAVDKAGNQSVFSTPASIVWTPDTTAPFLKIVSPSAGSFLKGTVEFLFNANSNDNLKNGSGSESATKLYEVSTYIDGKLLRVDKADIVQFEVDTTKLKAGARSLKVDAIDAVGNTTTKSLTFFVDNVKPVVSGLKAVPKAFKKGKSTKVNFLVKEPFNTYVTLKVVVMKGRKVIRSIEKRGLATKKGKPNTVVWDGKNTAGNFVGKGKYKVLVKASDMTGNEVAGISANASQAKSIIVTVK